MDLDELQKHQQTEIEECKDRLRDRLDHVASGVYGGLLEGEKLQEHQNSRLEAYLEGYADALAWAGDHVDRIDNIAIYVDSGSEDGDRNA